MSLKTPAHPDHVASGDGGYQSQRRQRGPGDHMALGEWTGAEGPAVFVDLTPGCKAGVAEMGAARVRTGGQVLMLRVRYPFSSTKCSQRSVRRSAITWALRASGNTFGHSLKGRLVVIAVGRR
jgi:hypothetical protein